MEEQLGGEAEEASGRCRREGRNGQSVEMTMHVNAHAHMSCHHDWIPLELQAVGEGSSGRRLWKAQESIYARMKTDE